MSDSYYAVHKGLRTGVFESWSQVKPLVTGFRGAMFKKFGDRSQAELYANSGELPIEEKTPETTPETPGIHRISETPPPGVHIYTDGAFSSKTKRCGVGVAFDAPHRSCAIAKTLPAGSTHQQAEIDAIVCALLRIHNTAEIRRCDHITIWTDSEYAVNCLTVWHCVWKQNGWLTAQNSPVKYRKLIEKGAGLLQLMPNVQLRHISEVGLVSHVPLDQNASPLARAVWMGNRKADSLARGL